MSKTSSNRRMTREEFLYHVKYVNWHPILTITKKIHREKHKIILRGLKDDKQLLYGPGYLRYDIVIDGVVGPDASTLDELLLICRSHQLLKYFYPILKEMIRKYEL